MIYKNSANNESVKKEVEKLKLINNETDTNDE